MLWLGRVYNSMVTKELQELQKYDILSQTDLQNIWKKASQKYIQSIAGKCKKWTPKYMHHRDKNG